MPSHPKARPREAAAARTAGDLDAGGRGRGPRRDPLDEELDEVWVELRAGVAVKLRKRLPGCEWFAVRAVVRHRVVRVADQDDPRPDGNLVARQAVGVSAAVPLLVCGPDELGNPAQRRCGGEHALAD